MYLQLTLLSTEKTDGMFATIVVVLPSYFTGGAAHLSFGDLSAVYDCSPKSQLETSVLAWYTDVTHEIKPITSGYRLALSYNLLHTTQSLRPALAAHNSVTEKLMCVLLAWRDDKSGNTPEKLLYLLDHKYSEANLKASALKGADAQKVALLDVLARKHGFRMGLANAHCRLSGYAEDYGGGHHRRGRRGWYGYDSYSDDDDDEDDGDVDFAEVESREMTIEHFVDLDGNLISKKLEFNEEEETIPADLADNVESGPHDGQDYEGYMGNVRTSIPSTHSPLTISPRVQAHWNDVCSRALCTLPSANALCRVPPHGARYLARAEQLQSALRGRFRLQIRR